jgi:hypothetical protein
MESIKEMIEKRAYELFLDRGGGHGYHIEDWLQAEKEIMAQLEKDPAFQATAAPVKPKAARKKRGASVKKSTARKKL